MPDYGVIEEEFPGARVPKLRGQEIRLYDEPLRGRPKILCEHCGGELEAYGEWVQSLIIEGSRPYLWRHRGTGERRCKLLPPEGRPYSCWDAHRQIKEQEREDGRIRDLAVERVDQRHGYTCEFSSDPEAHIREYDEEEALLRQEAQRV